jgi:hypothetical protein
MPGTDVLSESSTMVPVVSGFVMTPILFVSSFSGISPTESSKVSHST